MEGGSSDEAGMAVRTQAGVSTLVHGCCTDERDAVLQTLQGSTAGTAPLQTLPSYWGLFAERVPFTKLI